jgi:hypothetical protein
MSLVVFVIVLIGCNEASCAVAPLEPGITYPTEPQCLAAMSRKMTALLNMASHEHAPGRGEIVCALYAVPPSRLAQEVGAAG